MKMQWSQSLVDEKLDLYFDEKTPLQFGIDISTCDNLDEVIGLYRKKAKEHNFEIIDVDFFEKDFDKDEVNFWFPKIGMQTLIIYK